MNTPRLLAVAVTALALLTACTAGPSTRPVIVVNDGPEQQAAEPTAPSAAPVPPLEEPRGSAIRWNTCADNVLHRLTTPALPDWLKVQCSRVNVPLDSTYAPGRGNVRLQVLRAGTGPIPLVVLNDVGGQPGTIYAARLAATLPQDFLAKFSLIGLDRRGTGNSDPADCVPPEVRGALINIDPPAANAADWLEPAKTAGQQCSIELESRLPALDTWRTSADLEYVRQALGLGRLHAIGHGEGSRVLTVYADRYADRVGRFVLDGLPDANQDAVAALEGVAAGAEAAWQAFAADCKNRNCELAPDPNQALPTLLEQVRKSPLNTPALRVGPGVVLRSVLVGLADRTKWPALGTAIDAARKGDGVGLEALLAPVVQGSDEQAPTFDADLVVGCNDTKTRLTVQQVTSTAQEWTKKYPMFGGLVAQRLVLCGVWPVPSQPVGTPTAKGSPPIVVLGTAADPVTPLEGTDRAAHQLANAVLVSWQGGGHGALGVSSCATESAIAFLADGKVPRDGTACPP
jgi:pimeloyl-ACP methyl ester carboxylesterase